MSANQQQTQDAPRQPRRSVLRKIGAGLAWTLGAVIVLAVIFLCIATWMLTPDRLTGIINREASESLNADVTVHNARFTIWSSFPHFCIEMDSVNVTSRALSAIPASTRRQLPDNPDFLLSTSHLKGGINLIKLLKGEIWLQDLQVDSLSLNLVAVNDSLANYNIWQSSSDKMEIPYFTADSVVLRTPRHLKFFSLQSASNADINLDGASLQRSDSSLNTYRLRLNGKINATVDNTDILNGFPFILGGRIALSFNPFAIQTNDYDVKLGNTAGRLNMAMQMGDEVKVNNFTYSLDNFNLSKLLSYLPFADIPVLSDINADLLVNASARLTSPYSFSSSLLPSIEVDFNIPGGEMSYTVNNKETYRINKVDALARFMFDGKNPRLSYLEIPAFSIAGEGVDLTMNGRVSEIMDDPIVDFDIKGKADAYKAGRMITALRPFGIKGNLNTDIHLNFRIGDLRKGDLRNIGINGKINLSDYAARTPDGRNKTSGDHLDLSFGGQANALALNSLQNGNLKFKAKTGKINIHSDQANLNGRNLNLSANLNLKSQNITATLSGGHLDYAQAGTAAKFDKIKSTFSATRQSKPLVAPTFQIPRKWNADSLPMSFTDHSPKYLSVNIPDKIKKLMAQWRTHFSLAIQSGSVMSPAFPANNIISDLNLDASFDSLNIHSLNLRSRSSALSMDGAVTNLRQFLTSSSPAPLKFKLNLDIDTIQINQLAGTYQRGQILRHGAEAANKAYPDSISVSDTITMLIPRNIVADIHASAKQTQYLNLHLSNLLTDLKLRDGDLDIPRLHIESDFGAAQLGVLFSTSDVGRLGMELSAGLIDINVVRFFDNFHALLLMMPQMSNLSGDISAEMEAKLLIFPNMYINIPSIWADMYVQGDGLTVHQDHFIRRITKMMLIKTAGDIHIPDMKVHASVHDNLLELYPFDFEFDRYKLNMGGLNNFAGNLYYHIGVDKSPVPFPFGINIIGKFSHPEIRFGGATYKNKKGTEITSNIMENDRVNLMQQLKKYLHEFLSKAAHADRQ